VIHLCPICAGREVNDVKAHFKSGPCNLCGGTGHVDPDKVCICGRPAVLQIEGTKVCTRVECQRIVFEKKYPKVVDVAHVV
jgi:hypothetical protein